MFCFTEDVLHFKAMDFSDEEEEVENVSLSGDKKAENKEKETDELPSEFENEERRGFSEKGLLQEKPTAIEEEDSNWDTSDEEDEDDNIPQKEDNVPLGQRFFEQVNNKTEGSSSDDKEKDKTIESSPKEEVLSDKKADLMVAPSDKPEENWDWDSTDDEEEEEEDDLNEDDLPGFEWTSRTSTSQGSLLLLKI